jgi:hypothetical protein
MTLYLDLFTLNQFFLAAGGFFLGLSIGMLLGSIYAHR